VPVSANSETFIDRPLSVEGVEFHATCVSMGNPHCVTFVDDVNTAPVDTLGPKVETSEHFPNKTNVEFVHVVGRDEIDARVWERGGGETLACGTGACATLIACALNDKTGRSATVHLPGGDLGVTWKEDNHIILEGPATRVFTGTIDII